MVIAMALWGIPATLLVLVYGAILLRIWWRVMHLKEGT